MPNGMCTNATPCNVSTHAGCNGGRCFAYNGTPTCFAACIGTGTGATGRCRDGYVCVDFDTNSTNDNSTCRPLCTNDQECAGAGSGYGCNPWSKLCQNRDRGLARYGAACTSDAQCESNFCYRGADFPNGYCGGVCRADTRNCGPNGLCQTNTAFVDNYGSCYQACTGVGLPATCRASDNYKCWPTTPGGPTACLCIIPGGSCLAGGNSDCCSGICQFGICRCVAAGFSCSTDRQCCSGTCAGGTCDF
jgi:hypothetical protein